VWRNWHTQPATTRLVGNHRGSSRLPTRSVFIVPKGGGYFSLVFFSSSCRGVAQYGFLHFGHTLGSAAF
jgi:hypothetical protein